jgi:hypothetical protein
MVCDGEAARLARPNAVAAILSRSMIVAYAPDRGGVPWV